MRHDTNTLPAALRRAGTPEHALLTAISESDVTGTPLTRILVNKGAITERAGAEATAEAHGLPVADLTGTPPDPGAVRLIPLAMTKQGRAAPIRVTDGVATVVTPDPTNIAALDDIRVATGLPIEVQVCTYSEIGRLIDDYSRSDVDLTAGPSRAATPARTLADVDLSGDDTAPVVRYVSGLLARSAESHSSDIHIEPGRTETRIRIRIDGVLHQIDTAPSDVQPALVSRLKILSGLDITERRVPQNGRFTMTLTDGHRVDLRIATLPTVWGEKVILRLLDTATVDLDLRSMGFTESNYRKLSEGYNKPHGMVLVTGPTGSGKSTTLYAALTEVANDGINIVTVEDPVEYRIDGINQMQVDAKAGVTFAKTLPNILRSDPDVILVGEIRDRETARFSADASMTGHLVLATLHTNDAPSAIARLAELGVEPFQVASSLNTIVAQRLARRLCTWCRRQYTPGSEELDGYGWPAHLPRPESLWKASGCDACSGTGFKSRIAITEVMPVTRELRAAITTGASPEDLADLAVQHGMTQLRGDGLAKAAAGYTTVQEILRVTA